MPTRSRSTTRGCARPCGSAIDPDTIVKVALRGLGHAGEHHHVAPSHPDYAQLPKITRDVAEAKKLLAEAGYPERLRLELIVPTGPRLGQVAGRDCVEQWKEAGIRVKLNLDARRRNTGTCGPRCRSAARSGTTGRSRIMTLGLAYRTGGAVERVALFEHGVRRRC